MSKKTRKKSTKPTSKRSTAKASAKKRLKSKSNIVKKALKTSKAKPAKRGAKTSQTSKSGAAKVAKSKATPRAATSPIRKAGTLSEGMAAPSFSLPRDGGQSVSLASFAGRKLVIFFYPRADTPGCTREAIDFSRLSSAFAASQTTVLGVSADPVKAQESFRDKRKLSVPLISDEKQTMLKGYGVWGEKSMYGKTFMGIVSTTVLIDSRGKIARIWSNVKVDGHADEVLAAARAI